MFSFGKLFKENQHTTAQAKICGGAGAVKPLKGPNGIGLGPIGLVPARVQITSPALTK